MLQLNPQTTSLNPKQKPPKDLGATQNPSYLPRLGFLAHVSLGKLPAWDREGNLMDILAWMCFRKGPIL